MANAGLWNKEFRAGRLKFLAGLAVLTITAVSLPFIQDYTIRLMEKNPLPEFATGQLVFLKDFRYWMWSQWFGKNLVQIGSIIAIVFGAGIISSEVSDKTIQFLLSKPVRRQEVFTIKYVVSLIYLALAVAVSSIAAYVAALSTGHHFPTGEFLQYIFVAIAGLGVVFSIAVYLSTVFDRTLKSVVGSMLIAVALSAPGYIPALAKYSLYLQMSGYTIFSGAGFPVIPVILLVVISVGLHILGRKRFSRRDI
ncbi:MAG: ABC transporter permease [Eubacteriales bacterium]